jgi:hypothetical protein
MALTRRLQSLCPAGQTSRLGGPIPGLCPARPIDPDTYVATSGWAQSPSSVLLTYIAACVTRRYVCAGGTEDV